jgi:hypothetical protein
MKNSYIMSFYILLKICKKRLDSNISLQNISATDYKTQVAHFESKLYIWKKGDHACPKNSKRQ